MAVSFSPYDAVCYSRRDLSQNVRGRGFSACRATIVETHMMTTADMTGGSAGNRRVLLVDDSIDAAQAMSMLLEALGYEVRTEHDGPRGLASLDAFHPDVVVLDIGLPGMNGFDVAREMRKRDVTKDALLIAMTGYGSDADRQDAHAAGFDHHLTKPVSIDALEALLAKPRA
jgi:two-component system, OmpR family, response regulator